MGPIFLSMIGGIAAASASSVFSRLGRRRDEESRAEVGLKLPSISVRPSGPAPAPRPSFPGGLPQASSSSSSSPSSSSSSSWGSGAPVALNFGKVGLPGGLPSPAAPSGGVTQLQGPTGSQRPLSEVLALALRNVHLTDLSGPKSLADTLSSVTATSIAPGGSSPGDPWPGVEEQDNAEEEENEDEMSLYDNEEVGADEIYISETSGDDDEVGARAKRRPAKNSNAPRRIAFLPATSIAAASTVGVSVVLNKSFKGIGIRLSGTNQDKLLFNGATIRGTPQEASSGSVGCEIFTHPGETYFWEWDTVSPGESFVLSFTNTHTAAVTPTGYLIGYMSAT
jgi:hypothetical protein